MKKKIVSLSIVVLLVITILSLSGCGNEEAQKEETTQNIQNNEEIIKESPIKNGQYNMVLTTDDISIGDGDIFLEIKDNNITIYNSFAQIVQEGSFDINDNKLTGIYTKVTYLDQQNGGAEAEKTISDKLEFEILENGNLRDNLGFGQSLNNNLFKGREYKLKYEDIGNNEWENLYLRFILNGLPESTSAEENDINTSPFISLIDLNFDNVPELLYYDGEMFFGYGGKEANIYTIEDGKVIYKDKITIKEDEHFLKIDNKYISHYSEEYYEPTGNYVTINIIEKLEDKTLSRVDNSFKLDGKELTEEEFYDYVNKYSNGTNKVVETLTSKTIMNNYTDQEKTNIFNELINK